MLLCALGKKAAAKLGGQSDFLQKELILSKRMTKKVLVLVAKTSFFFQLELKPAKSVKTFFLSSKTFIPLVRSHFYEFGWREGTDKGQLSFTGRPTDRRNLEALLNIFHSAFTASNWRRHF